MNNCFTSSSLTKSSKVKFPFAKAGGGFIGSKSRASGIIVKAGLLMLILSCMAICSFGQVSIKGRITDGKQNLPFANVVLLSADSVLVKGVATDSIGEFIFAN